MDGGATAAEAHTLVFLVLGNILLSAHHTTKSETNWMWRWGISRDTGQKESKYWNQVPQSARNLSINEKFLLVQKMLRCE